MDTVLILMATVVGAGILVGWWLYREEVLGKHVKLIEVLGFVVGYAFLLTAAMVLSVRLRS